MSLSHLVAQEKWQEFDDAWSELMLSGGAIEDLFAALRLAGEKKRLARCLPMVREHAEILGGGGRAAEAARLLGLALLGGGAAGELYDPLVTQAEKAWGTEPWWPKYADISGLRPSAPDARGAWVAFDRLMSFSVGRVVFHAGGWGVGEITELRHDVPDVSVRFGGGREDRFPLDAALEIFEPLREEDLRSLYFRSPEGLRKTLREEPLEILKAVLERHHGRATNLAIKNALVQVGIEGSAWSGWWRKARKQAEASEWFRVTGTLAKGEVQLLHAATDPVLDMRRSLEHIGSISDLLTRVRSHRAAAAGDERIRAMLLEVLEKRAEKGVDPEPARLSAWLYLRQEKGEMTEALRALLQRVADAPGQVDSTRPPALWALFQTLGSMQDQEACIGLLKDLSGDRWLDEASQHLQHAPAGMIRPLVDALAAAGRRDELLQHYRELLGRPLRSPDALVSIAKLGETGKLGEDLPPPVQRAEALLSLATYVFVNRRGDPKNARTQVRLTEFLTKGKEPPLRRWLVDAEDAQIHKLARLLQRGVDETIDIMFHDIASHVPPPASQGRAAHFWENDRIWTTRRGLERRRAELHHLREVKIPANQDAIGRAAAMGDLSENAEWEAAIEDQRNLTSRAAAIEQELRLVELIENALVPEELVCPGTVVRYRDLGENEEHEIEILGPWDTDDAAERVVSYRAPLAAGLLGHRAGDKVRIELPSGFIDVEILGVVAP
ncbi:MAG: GreA/GreB family elongation factor [Planctomycetota bacterium]